MTENEHSSSAPNFAELGLSAKVLAAVEKNGYTLPTPIQAGAIPEILEHNDVLGIAQTGTGKTASFVLPMLTLLETGRARIRMPRTIVIAPTRELAAQIADNFEIYSKEYRLNIALLIGGASFDEQDRKLERGADVLIATPGRLLDHYNRGKLLLTGVEMLVIDEADRMLDMGFIPDIEKICKLLPITRQTVLFSATMPEELEALAQQFLHNPKRIEVAAASSTALTITQHLVKSEKKPWNKRRVLRHLIKEEGEKLKNAIIFCNRKKDVSELFRSLSKYGFNAGTLHGDMEQHHRSTVLENFRNDKLQLLVASDVAARGLDIPDVSHVFNFDVPMHAEDYVHRIGRTGRAGRDGIAYTIVTNNNNDSKHIESIEKIIGNNLSYLEIDISKDSKSSRDNAKNQKEKTSKKPKKQEIQEAKKNVSEDTNPTDNNDKESMSDKQQTVSNASKNTAKKQSTSPKNKVLGFGSHVPAFMRIPTQ